ncbi:DUF4412 domain-containing protein [Larkinella punicea]|uniref:DUF4412 domain-containing protein n=1 Tax=Larkinella punicea TaxID=2315727 RepID=A0A368JNY1_9BACT|nr:DUF4412 domain-containing protein [Larkinella punicea]RCR69005.1 DUF4412 domain-containing protein [Larkinella punicea]
MKKILSLLTTLLLPAFVWAQQGTVEYKMTMSQGAQSRTTTSTMYFSNGNVRTDVSIPFPGAAKPMKQTILMLAKTPNVTYMLNESSKTYTENRPNPSKNTPAMKATVKVVGKEKIQNLNCTHALVTFDKGSMEIWTSKDIPGYEKLLSYWRSNQDFGGENLYTELKKSGADGFFVRMKNAGMTMDLVRYDTKPVSASLFDIPKDYKKGAAFDPAGFQNMTPAQRQKMIEAFKKQPKP